VTAPTVAIGATPAQSGALRLGNAGEIRARNVANTQDARLLMVDNENNLIMGSVDNPAAGMYVDAPGAITMRPSAATASYTLDAVGLKPDTDGARYLGTGPKRWLQAHISDSVAIGASPAQSGALRLGNNQAILMRNGANTGDVVVANVAPDNQLQIGANAGGVTVYPPAYFASSPYVAAPLRVQASVEIGATPAQSGALRLGSDGAIHARNAANTGDNRVIETLGDQLYVGWSGITHANIKTATGDVYFSNTGGFTFTLSPTGGFFPASDGVVDCGHPAGRWNMAHIKTAVAIGATPAQSGALRLGNNEYVKIRNGTNTDDLLGLAASANTIYVGDHIAGSLVLRSAGTVEAPNLILTGTPFLQMTERPAIGNAPANGAYVFLQDNGSGKTQLMIQFATGAAIQLAIQP
jgi:hypothetical protein